MSSESAETFDRAFLGFVQTLKAIGIHTDQHRVQTAYRAIGALGGFTERDHLYLAGKFSFCSRQEDLAKYHMAFEAWFGGLYGRRVRQTEIRNERTVIVPSTESGLDQISDDEVKSVATASEIEVLREADIALLAPDARAQVEAWIAQLRPSSRMKRTRRFDGGGTASIDRRKSVRAALRAGGEVAEIFFRDRRIIPRRILFLIDVSGSMKAYSGAYLRFAYAMKKARGSTEVFTMGTRLTQVTRSLSDSNVQSAVNRALQEIPDWSGGTRLGVQLRHFLREFGVRGSARGAIVVIASDGWERGDVQTLSAGMEHLSRLANRIVWVNPHLHRPGFAPLTAGMEVALPHVDRLVNGHSFNSFESLCKEIVG